MSRDDYTRARHDLGACEQLEPESVGPAGSRLFRLRAAGEYGSALIWLEKEELHELALTVKRVLRTGVRQTGAAGMRNELPSSEPTDFEFKVVGLALAYDRDSGRYLFVAQKSEDDAEDAVAMWVDRDVLNKMADRAFEVHSAGRPRCPLCNSALDASEPHACPRAN